MQHPGKLVAANHRGKVTQHIILRFHCVTFVAIHHCTAQLHAPLAILIGQEAHGGVAVLQLNSDLVAANICVLDQCICPVIDCVCQNVIDADIEENVVIR